MGYNRILPLVLGLTLTATVCRAAETVTVFAAASMTNAVEEVISRFEDNMPGGIRSSFAASSTLARQIEAGAPASVFISANSKWMDYLQDRGLINPGTRRNLASNRLVVIGARSETTLPINLGGTRPFAMLLGDRGRMAIGDPAHVPAGIYARQALEKLGLWKDVSNRLALTDNVRGALTLVARGETPVGIVYATDVALSDQVRVLTMLSPASHEAILYPVALVSGGETTSAREFLAFLTGLEGAAILRKHGFEEADGL
ncbi:MAG: molybdate ABC transporter substrate-binding protein [Rhodospirillales bacterium]